MDVEQGISFMKVKIGYQYLFNILILAAEAVIIN